MRAGLALVLLIVVASSAVGATTPTSTPTVDPLAKWTLIFRDGPVCEAAGTGRALGSYLAHEPVAGTTRWEVRVTTAPGSACPSFSLRFDADAAAWPARGASSTAAVTSACGASGVMDTHQGDHHRFVAVLELDVPAACGAGAAGGVVVWMQPAPVRPAAYVACSPTGLDGGPLCTGATEERWDGVPCPDGRSGGRTSGPGVVGMRDCSDGEPRTGFGTNMAQVWADRDGCSLWIGGAVRDVPCPAAAREALLGVPWGHLLP